MVMFNGMHYSLSELPDILRDHNAFPTGFACALADDVGLYRIPDGEYLLKHFQVMALSAPFDTCVLIYTDVAHIDLNEDQIDFLKLLHKGTRIIYPGMAIDGLLTTYREQKNLARIENKNNAAQVLGSLIKFMKATGQEDLDVGESFKKLMNGQAA